MMTRAMVMALVMLPACAGAPRSRWQTSELVAPGSQQHVYMVCTCDGHERSPTPSEAASFADGEEVDQLCEGKVHDCHRGDPHGNTLPQHRPASLD